MVAKLNTSPSGLVQDAETYLHDNDLAVIGLFPEGRLRMLGIVMVRWLSSILLGARTLLGAPGLTTRSKDATRGSRHR